MKSKGKKKKKVSIHTVKIDPALESAGARFWSVEKLREMERVYWELAEEVKLLRKLRQEYDRQFGDQLRQPAFCADQLHLN